MFRDEKLDLVGEVYTAALNMRRSHEDWLSAHSVSPVAIYSGPPRLHGHFGVSRAQFHGDLYESDPDGVPVIVMACFEHPDEPPVDLVAFQPSDPTRWWLRLGNAIILGLHNARLALFEQAPILVHPTPLSWLQADCAGTVVLDWKRDVLSYLDGYGVLAADGATGKRLRRAFRRHIHVPEIRVLGEHRAAA